MYAARQKAVSANANNPSDGGKNRTDGLARFIYSKQSFFFIA